jgi:hypothetical protein
MRNYLRRYVYKAVLRDSTAASTAAIEAQRDLAVTYRALNQPEKAAQVQVESGAKRDGAASLR